jgi:predicted nucleic acid-binding protein
LASHPEP